MYIGCISCTERHMATYTVCTCIFQDNINVLHTFCVNCALFINYFKELWFLTMGGNHFVLRHFSARDCGAGQGEIITLASLSWEKVSTMIPKMMFRPTVVTRMKKVTSKTVTCMTLSKSSSIRASKVWSKIERIINKEPSLYNHFSNNLWEIRNHRLYLELDLSM